MHRSLFGPNIQTEIEKRMAVLSDTDIRGVFSYICDRNCRHDKDCRNKISDGISVSDALKTVEDFRKHIWINPEELGNTTDEVQKLSGRDHRTVMLIDNLFQVRSPHNREIEYTIGFDKVTITIYYEFHDSLIQLLQVPVCEDSGEKLSTKS